MLRYFSFNVKSVMSHLKILLEFAGLLEIRGGWAKFFRKNGSVRRGAIRGAGAALASLAGVGPEKALKALCELFRACEAYARTGKPPRR